MTEHFTREEAAALAKAAGFEVRRGLGLRESVPEDVFARGLINEEVTALCNAAVTAIDKKREAQGAVGVVNVSNGYKGIPNIAVAWMQEVSHGAKLYAHALPAQPAEPVNAELVSAAERVSLKYGHDDDGTPSDWTEWKDLREAISRAVYKAMIASAQPQQKEG